MVENSLSLERDMDIHKKELKASPKDSIRTDLLQQSLGKLSKIRQKERIQMAVRKKASSCIFRKLIRQTADF